MKGKKKASPQRDEESLFLGNGVRAITRKSMLPGYTVSDLEQFLNLLYGMFDEHEAKEVRVFDPFAQEKARRVTVARLADALANLIATHEKSA